MLVVSLTTIRSRLHMIERVVRSLRRQSLVPDAFVLNVSTEPYLLDQGIAEADLPAKLRRLRDAGKLTISWVPNHGSYRKLFPLVADYAESDAVIVTADDDVVYPPDWLRGLVEAHERTGRCTAYRTRAIRVRDGRIMPYKLWPFVDPERGMPASEVRPDSRALFLMPTGRDGILYRAAWFRPVDLLPTLREIAPKQDDLAFRCLLMSRNVEVDVVPYAASGRGQTFKFAGETGASLYENNIDINTGVFVALLDHLEQRGLFRLADHIAPSPTTAEG